MSDLDRDPLHDPLRDLLADAVSDVEPRHALDEIRARVRPTPRRWPYAAGGAVLGIAATVATYALLDTDALRELGEPRPAGSPPPSAVSPVPSDTASPDPGRLIAVYYIGDTPGGPRLFREWRPIPSTGDPFEHAVQQLEQLPQDPDYRTAWTEGSLVETAFDGVGEDGLLQVTLADESFATRRQGMSPDEGRLAVEQVVYTLQALIGARAPVQFYLGDNPINQVRGVPTSEPIVEGPMLETLSQVSLSDPSEGLLVPRDRPLRVRGVANSVDGRVTVRLQRWEGTHVVDQQVVEAGTSETRLSEFSLAFDVSQVPPGDYVVIASADAPYGLGAHDDDRRVTIVD